MSYEFHCMHLLQKRQAGLNVKIRVCFRSHVLQKVCMYFTYKVRYTNSSTEIPEFPIAPEIALELLMAANFLDCWDVAVYGTANVYGCLVSTQSLWLTKDNWDKLRDNDVDIQSCFQIKVINWTKARVPLIMDCDKRGWSSQLCESRCRCLFFCLLSCSMHAWILILNCIL